jgi:hypothetical protein
MNSWSGAASLRACRREPAFILDEVPSSSAFAASSGAAGDGSAIGGGQIHALRLEGIMTAEPDDFAALSESI